MVCEHVQANRLQQRLPYLGDSSHPLARILISSRRYTLARAMGMGMIPLDISSLCVKPKTSTLNHMEVHSSILRGFLPSLGPYPHIPTALLLGTCHGDGDDPP